MKSEDCEYTSLETKLGYYPQSSIFLLQYSIKKRPTDKHIGKWVMFSTSQWNSEFPFWSRSTVQRTFVSLQDQGIVISRKLTKQEIVSMLKRKRPQQLNTELDFYTCEWCNCETFILNEHHYPISQEDDGTETVKICPNCHYEFHSLELLILYSLDQKFIIEFDGVNNEKEHNASS